MFAYSLKNNYYSIYSWYEYKYNLYQWITYLTLNKVFFNNLLPFMTFYNAALKISLAVM